MLKGGILLAAYGVRRPTRDADANAVGADVTADHLVAVVRNIAAVESDDGVVFDLDSISVQEIREHAKYARYRGVTLEPIAPRVVGYGQIGQAKWAAWRRKERLEAVCDADLDEQLALVASYLDPVFSRGDAPPARP